MSVFGGDFRMKVSQLQALILRAVDPIAHDPDYAAHLEVAEYINSKKANTPRDAAMAIARIVNDRNPHVALLALALIETLVQQCGYAFHLQISTKEFLNELVRRFPERPPPFPGPVMTKILELINTWKETICTNSRWKEDLGNIRDMYRLLTFKGYRFRDVARPQSLAVASTSNLKSAEELEDEDREAQHAKLQELIRRGTPRDLAAAQELMKSLAGAEPEKKPDYRSQSLAELNKLEQKVILLNEMLDNVDVNRGEQFANGDAYDQVSQILVAARPRIQKWISDAESNDPEMLDIFLQLNDQINSVLNRYEAFKRGDYSVAANPIPVELASTSRTQQSSLIDFDDPLSNVSSGASKATDDLADLFGPGTASGQTSGGSQNNGQFSTMQQPIPQITNGGSNGLADIFGGSHSTPPQPRSPGTHATFGSISLPLTPGPLNLGQSQHQAQGSSQYTSSMAPNQPQGTFWAMQQGSSMGTSSQFQSQRPSMTPTTPAQPVASSMQSQTKDPFADLAGLF